MGLGSDSHRATRRRVLAGAAWTTPVVLATTAAPVFAASCGDSTFTAPAAASWSVSRINMTTNGGTDGFLTGGYRVVSDPASGQTASVTVTTNTPVYFQAATAYTFTFNFTRYTSNSRSLTFSLLVGTTTVVGSTVTTKPAAGTSPVTAVYTPATSGCANVSLSFVFGNQSGTTGDDIDITNLARSPA